MRKRFIFNRLVFHEFLMRLAEKYIRGYYRADQTRLWRNKTHPPEWFDHRADLYLWSDRRSPFWPERGVYSVAPMFQGCKVLDLCCGEGFFAYHFYTSLASHIDAVDWDRTAIAHARKWHSDPKIHYHVLNAVTKPFPRSHYHVICWDAAIEHFTELEIRLVLEKCVTALKPDGVLTGYTILTNPGPPVHPDHHHEFHDRHELISILHEFFPCVAMIETVYPTRRNIYFRAAFKKQRLNRF